MESKLEIHFTRVNQRADCDDTIKITRFGGSEYKVEYYNKSERVRNFMYMKHDDIIPYIEDVLNFASVDSEPFEFIQFTFPCLPSFMFTVDQLNNFYLRQTINNRIRGLLGNWPESSRA